MFDLVYTVCFRLFYEPWALFLDGERSSTMPAMARGNPKKL